MNFMSDSGITVKMGREGIFEVYESLKTTTWYYSLYSTDVVIENWGQYSEELGKAVAENGTLVRELIAGLKIPVPYQEYFKSPDQEIRYLPHGNDINTDLIIYENKVVIISYDPEMKVVIMEDQGIFDMAKTMFDLLWEGTPEFIDVNSMLGLLNKPTT
jgi:hypothetical protein